MDLTVIINCYNDPYLFTCINSIDEDIEVLVVLADSKNIQLELERRHIRFVNTTLGNYSRNCNLGIAHASHDRVLIVDSDCSFKAGCIKQIYELLKEYEIVRCQVEFLSDKKVCLSSVVARLRNAVNNRLPIRAYTPGIGFRRSVASRIGGYFFDEDVKWASDSELNMRIMKAEFLIKYDPSAIIYHQPISFIHEIRSGYRLGRGQRTIVGKGLRPNYETLRMILGKLLNGYIYKCYRDAKNIGGWQGILITLCWDIAFYAGYYYQRWLSK